MARIETVQLKIDNSLINGPLLAVELALESWPQSRVDEFQEKWDAVVGLGCELATAAYCHGVIYGELSDDFTAHCRSFGIEI